MSRFFRAGSESETESDSSGEEPQVPRPAAAGAARNVFQLSDDEEDTKRVVRSEKDKRFEEINNVIRQLKNHKKIKDMSNVLSGIDFDCLTREEIVELMQLKETENVMFKDFESLGKAYEKAKKVVDKEGIPRFYIRCLVELEDFVNECWEDKDWRKQISKSNAKGLTTLRQKLKKYLRDFTDDVTKYRENPDAGDEEEAGTTHKEAGSDRADDDDEDDDEDASGSPRKPARKVSDDEEDSDDSEFWGSSTTESDSDSGEEGRDTMKLTAEYFLKKTTEDERLRREEKKKERKKEKELKKKFKEEDEGEWKEVKGGVPLMTEKPKMFSKDQEITHEAVLKKMAEIMSARGKKSTDRSEQIELFKELLTVSDTAGLGPGIQVKIMFNIIAAIFDYNPNIATCMRAEVWESCLNHIQELLTVLMNDEDIIIGEHIPDDTQSFETTPYRVRGCILTVVERMDEEFTKMLQACDAHSTEYVERLKDEQRVADLTKLLEKYMDKRATTDEMCRVYLRRIEQTYYKFDYKAMEGQNATEGVKAGESGDKSEETPEQMMDRLCKYIYAKDSTDRLRTRAMLCHIYHHALHDRWYQARDLMLMSHLQDTIHHSDVRTQLLYNRTLVQLGLCGFRRGMIRDAHNALVDIQSSNRAKELLAQGLLPQRQHERSPEQEKIEKRRLLPYHKHINLELLECVYLVSAMLLEIPYMAAHELDVRRRMISKNFHHVLKMSERQNLTGPPESMREHVVAASKAMKTGDWKACKNFIINEKMNAKVWELFYNKDAVREMITSKIQEESLRTYLFTYSSVYDSLSMDTLAEMFELNKAVVHSIISKMIINEELMASLDEPTQTVVMHRTEPSRLQSLALQLSEKVATLVENNERIMEMKQGNFYFQKSSNQNYQQNQNWNKYSNRREWDNQNQGWNRRNRQQRNY